MRYLALATLVSSAIASPLAARGVTTETVTADAGVIGRKDDDSPASIAFTLHSETSGISTRCATGAGANIQINGDLYSCDDESYSFRYVEHVAYPRYKVTVYHQLGQFSGVQGNLTIGCNGPIPTACSQVGTATTTLCSDLTVCGKGADN